MKNLDLLLEEAVIDLLKQEEPSLNYYTSDSTEDLTWPYVAVQAKIVSEQIGPKSGVFSLDCLAELHQKADDTTAVSHSEMARSLLQAFYYTDSVATRLSNVISSNANVFDARLNSIQPRVSTEEREWIKAFNLEVIATPNSLV